MPLPAEAGTTQAGRIQTLLPFVECQMERNRYLLAEKIAVYTSVAVLLGLTYFAIAGITIPAGDPTGPIMPLATGDFGGEILILGMFAVLTAAAGWLCGGLRFSGVWVIVLGSMTGFSMKSGFFRTLLWDGTTPGRAFAIMTVELAILGLVGVGCEIIASLLWNRSRRKMGEGGWRDISFSLDNKQLAALTKENIKLPNRLTAWQDVKMPTWMRESFLLSTIMLIVNRKSVPSRHEAVFQKHLANSGGFFLVSMLTGVVCVYVILQGLERGQAVFAAFGAFYLAVRIAYHFYPVPDNFSAWIMPVLAGIIYYLVGLFTVVPGPEAFAAVKPQLQALPIDWFFAGGCGATFGLWSAGRATDTKIIEHLHLAPEEE